MAYLEDKNLEFLQYCPSEDLKLLVDFLVERNSSEKLTSVRGFNNSYPNFLQKIWKDIATEIQHLGGSPLANMFRTTGIPYREILEDVAKKLKININKEDDTENIEAYLLQSVFINGVSMDKFGKFLEESIELVPRTLSPAYRITIPCVFIIASMRIEYIQRLEDMSKFVNEIRNLKKNGEYNAVLALLKEKENQFQLLPTFITVKKEILDYIKQVKVNISQAKANTFFDKIKDLGRKEKYEQALSLLDLNRELYESYKEYEVLRKDIIEKGEKSFLDKLDKLMSNEDYENILSLISKHINYYKSDKVLFIKEKALSRKRAEKIKDFFNQIDILLDNKKYELALKNLIKNEKELSSFERFKELREKTLKLLLRALENDLNDDNYEYTLELLSRYENIFANEIELFYEVRSKAIAKKKAYEANNFFNDIEKLLRKKKYEEALEVLFKNDEFKNLERYKKIKERTLKGLKKTL